MTKYQLFDECYGAFGEIYATESEAKNALESVIAEYFVDTAVGMAIREEQAADYNYREPRQIRQEEVVAEIRRSLFINEVEVADPEPEQADNGSDVRAICRREFGNRIAKKYFS